jgi:hypothetical protein
VQRARTEAPRPTQCRNEYRSEQRTQETDKRGICVVEQVQVRSKMIVSFQGSRTKGALTSVEVAKVVARAEKAKRRSEKRGKGYPLHASQNVKRGKVWVGARCVWWVGWAWASAGVEGTRIVWRDL